jgi:hypothetical protein
VNFRSLALGSFAIAAVASLPFSFAACSSKATLAGQGAQCNLTTDCEEGLVCIPQKGGTSTCSSNLGSIQQLPPATDSGAPAPVSDAGENDDGPGITVPEDTGAPPKTNDAAND